MKSYKIVGIAFAALAVLFASAIPSYAWQPRTRLNVFRNTCGNSTKHTLDARIQARGGILSKIGAVRASCGSSAATKFTVSSCGGTAASCNGRSAAPSCAASVPTTASAPTPVPTTVYMEFAAPTDCNKGYCTPVRNVIGAVAQSAKGSLQFAQQLASEGRMYHDRSYIGYENVASGASSPEDAVRMWQNSPPHRRNLPFITDIQCVNGFCVGR